MFVIALRCFHEKLIQNHFVTSDIGPEHSATYVLKIAHIMVEFFQVR